MAFHDVIHMFLEQWPHKRLQFFTDTECLDFGRIGQTIHHVGDAALFQAFGYRFPTVLDQFRGVGRVDAFGHHQVVAEDGTGLQHAAQNGLFAHQIGFHFGNERRFKHAGTMTAGSGSIGLGDFEAVTIRIVLTMYRDQRRHAEAAFVFFTHFGSRAFRRDHDDGDVLADLHAFLDDVETV